MSFYCKQWRKEEHISLIIEKIMKSYLELLEKDNWSI